MEYFLLGPAQALLVSCTFLGVLLHTGYNSDLISALQPTGVECKGNGEGVAGSLSTTKALDEQEDAFPYTKRDGLQVSKALRRVRN